MTEEFIVLGTYQAPGGVTLAQRKPDGTFANVAVVEDRRLAVRIARLLNKDVDD